ncbi:hypothetical protein BC937DRAFT_94841 [Endogone sp. FLAS-F59071]|nr:hypothetical protein BC937DRAFT_94841 [Endogone sp. FLAS-F59071]|eukprot:RUS13743.1 hypothetical protein BC937DRAFT_94841 [Endogone sp. FLAS-F59071]
MFKRARKELNKQSILTKDPHDIYDDEELLEGLSSDSDDDNQSDQEDSQTDSGSDEDESEEEIGIGEEGEEEGDRGADDNEEDEEGGDQEADDSEAEGGSSEDGDMIYKCKICPERVLQNEKMVELHLESKVWFGDLLR